MYFKEYEFRIKKTKDGSIARVVSFSRLEAEKRLLRCGCEILESKGVVERTPPKSFVHESLREKRQKEYLGRRDK